MLQIIALFCPGFLSMEVFDSLGEENDSFSKRKLLQRYAAFTLLDVATAIFIVKALHPGISLSVGLNFSDTFLNGLYFISVMFCSVFWGYAAKVLTSLFHVRIEAQTISEDSENSNEA